MLTVLYGTSDLLKRERLAQLLAEEDPSGLSTTRFAAGTTLDTIFTAACTPGFFGEKRVVIAENLVSTYCRAGRIDDSLLSRLREVPPSAHLVCLEVSLTETALGQLRTALGEAVALVDCTAPRGRDLVRWVQERAHRYGVAIEVDAARDLLALLGIGDTGPGAANARTRDAEEAIDLNRLDTELAKLATAVFPDKVISRAVIHELVDPSEAPLGWELVDAVRRDRYDAVLRELARAEETGTPPELLLGQLASHLETLLAAMLTPHLPSDVVAAATGLLTARINQARRQLPQGGLQRVRELLLALRTVDAGLKRGSLNDIEAALAAALGPPDHWAQPRSR